jgi:hypothetical protein
MKSAVSPNAKVLGKFAALHFCFFSVTSIASCDKPYEDRSFDLCCGYRVQDAVDTFWILDREGDIVIWPKMLIQSGNTDFFGSAAYDGSAYEGSINSTLSGIERKGPSAENSGSKCVYFHLQLGEAERLRIFSDRESLRQHLGDRMINATPMEKLYSKSDCDLDPSGLVE